MILLITWLEMFGLSSISVIIIGFLLKIKWWKMLFGIPAYALAYYAELRVATPYDLIILIVFIAPVIEEVSKFLFTIFGRNARTGAAVGLMFAFIENATYFYAYRYMLLYIFGLREFTDPILHSSTTSISSKSYNGNVLWLVIAIGMHMLWNYLSIVIADNGRLLPLIFFLAVIYAIALYMRIYWKKKQKHQENTILKAE